MTQWGLDNLFNPGKRHMDDEKRRLQSTREEVGDNSGGRRIDLEAGKVSISVRRPTDVAVDDRDPLDDVVSEPALEAEELPAVALGNDDAEIFPELVDEPAPDLPAEPDAVIESVAVVEPAEVEVFEVAVSEVEEPEPVAAEPAVEPAAAIAAEVVADEPADDVPIEAPAPRPGRRRTPQEAALGQRLVAPGLTGRAARQQPRRISALA